MDSLQPFLTNTNRTCASTPMPKGKIGQDSEPCFRDGRGLVSDLHGNSSRIVILLWYSNTSRAREMRQW